LLKLGNNRFEDLKLLGCHEQLLCECGVLGCGDFVGLLELYCGFLELV
jgi:hypothetical protein